MLWAISKGLLAGYRYLVSPILHQLAGPGYGCRFTPTCSEFAAEAVARHGGKWGVLLAVKRLCRCHPWGSAGGWDPVPREVGPEVGKGKSNGS